MLDSYRSPKKFDGNALHFTMPVTAEPWFELRDADDSMALLERDSLTAKERADIAHACGSCISKLSTFHTGASERWHPPWLAVSKDAIASFRNHFEIHDPGFDLISKSFRGPGARAQPISCARGVDTIASLTPAHSDAF